MCLDLCGCRCMHACTLLCVGQEGFVSLWWSVRAELLLWRRLVERGRALPITDREVAATAGRQRDAAAPLRWWSVLRRLMDKDFPFRMFMSVLHEC